MPSSPEATAERSRRTNPATCSTRSAGGGELSRDHRGVDLALHQAQLKVERGALVLDAPEQFWKLATWSAAASGEVDGRLPADEDLVEPCSQPEHLAA